MRGSARANSRGCFLQHLITYQEGITHVHVWWRLKAAGTRTDTTTAART